MTKFPCNTTNIILEPSAPLNPPQFPTLVSLKLMTPCPSDPSLSQATTTFYPLFPPPKSGLVVAVYSNTALLLGNHQNLTTSLFQQNIRPLLPPKNPIRTSPPLRGQNHAYYYCYYYSRLPQPSSPLPLYHYTENAEQIQENNVLS